MEQMQILEDRQAPPEHSRHPGHIGDLGSTLLTNQDPVLLRRAIRASFHATFALYTRLFDVLADEEAYFVKPISLRHPLIFYFGHTATFFVNKLVLAGMVDARLDPRLESLCAVGVDEMSWDDLDEAHYAWPTVAEVRTYRERVRALVDGVIERLPEPVAVGWDSPWWVILMGIEHERIHLETSSVLIRQHQLRYVRPNAAWRPCEHSGAAPANGLVDIPACALRLGRERADPLVYGWDNEFGDHRAEVTAFKAARCLVSNAEFLAFVDAGGYDDDALWSDEGRAWKRFARVRHPTFWVPEDGGWRLRLLAEEVPMRWDWPVETNFHEAWAFCAWMARETGQPVRLPTEDEWQAMRVYAGVPDLPQSPPLQANLELQHWASSCPVNRFAHGPLYDVVGNVWQWTDTPTYPFPGFKVHPIYDDFTTPTFDGLHAVIKGGSWISCGNEALPWSRYAFRRHFFQHAGFRYVVGAPAVQPPDSHYETDRLVADYCEFHYGDPCFGVPNFPAALARLALEALGDAPARRALDLGCATGRATFELARRFEHVTGVDFSARFVGVGTQMAEQGRVRYAVVDEGDLVSYHERTLEQFGLAHTASRVAFLQGDACNLKSALSGYDLILAANLIDRLYSPALFLRDVHARLNPGGLLLLASPYTWLEDHTKREEWIGGFKRDGENVTTLDGLKAMLSPHFDLVGTPRDVPFVIRETRRKHQHTISEVSIWKRR